MDSNKKLEEELAAAVERIQELETSLKVASQHDDLMTLLDRYTDYELMIPLVKYLIHAMLYHFCKGLQGNLLKCSLELKMPRYLADMLSGYVWGEFDPQREEKPSEEEIREALHKELRQLYSIMINMLEPYIKDNMTQALIYQQIADEDTDIEKILPMYPVEDEEE